MTPTTVYGSPFNVTGRPRIFGSPPKRRCQSRWLRMTSCSRPGSVSSGRNRRPRVGCTPSIGSTSSVRRTAWMLSGSSVPVRFGVQLSAAPMLSNTVFCRRQSTKFAGATGLLAAVQQHGELLRAARYGRGRRRTALTTLKIAVLAPMPSARASTAAAVKAGVRARAARPVAQVLEDRLEKGAGADVPHRFLDLLAAAAPRSRQRAAPPPGSFLARAFPRPASPRRRRRPHRGRARRRPCRKRPRHRLERRVRTDMLLLTLPSGRRRSRARSAPTLPSRS